MELIFKHSNIVKHAGCNESAELSVKRMGSKINYDAKQFNLSKQNKSFAQ